MGEAKDKNLNYPSVKKIIDEDLGRELKWVHIEDESLRAILKELSFAQQDFKIILYQQPNIKDIEKRDCYKERDLQPFCYNTLIFIWDDFSIIEQGSCFINVLEKGIARILIDDYVSLKKSNVEEL